MRRGEAGRTVSPSLEGWPALSREAGLGPGFLHDFSPAEGGGEDRSEARRKMGKVFDPSAHRGFAVAGEPAGSEDGYEDML